MELAKNYQVRTTPEQRKKINDLLNCGFTEIHADDLIAMLTKFPKSAENPLQGMELTPEFEAAEPTFKVGDKVYKYGETDVKTVLEVFEDGHMRISNYPHSF